MTENKIKTGTTCIGLKFKDGVMLAADNRVTSYKINADNFVKIFDLSENIVANVSGGVADAQRFIRIIQSELKLIELKTERKPLVKEAAMILSNIQYSALRSQGSIVGMLLGGYDGKEGISLYELSPEGSLLENSDYVTSGSGSIFVDGILSSEYKKDLSKTEALALIEKCFKVAFKNDSASGGGFIVKIVTKDKGIEEAARKVVKSEIING